MLCLTTHPAPPPTGVIPWGPSVDELIDVGKAVVGQVLQSQRTPLVSLLLRGNAGCGKTALAAHIAKQCNFPFVKVHGVKGHTAFRVSGYTAFVVMLYVGGVKACVVCN